MPLIKNRFLKVTTLPGTLEPNTFYFVENGNYAESYLTNSSGVAKMIGNTTMINQLITSQLAQYNAFEIVADITARNALASGLNRNLLVLVIDATGDTTVGSGSALYAFHNDTDTWEKLTEYENLDVTIQWSAIQGKPTSAVADIDDAVTKRHVHANKAKLDLIDTDVDGNLTYNGDPVMHWDQSNW